MIHTEETKAKLSAMRKGSANPFYGKKHSDETRAKLAANLKRFNDKRRYVIKPCTIKALSAQEWYYLAGVIDGEGSIRFRNGRPFVAVYNSDARLINWLLESVGGSITGQDKRGRVVGYQWTVGAANDVAMICIRLLPILKIKSEDAKKAFTFLKEKYGSELKY